MGAIESGRLLKPVTDKLSNPLFKLEYSVEVFSFPYR